MSYKIWKPVRNLEKDDSRAVFKEVRCRGCKQVHIAVITELFENHPGYHTHPFFWWDLSQPQLWVALDNVYNLEEAQKVIEDILNSQGFFDNIFWRVSKGIC